MKNPISIILVVALAMPGAAFAQLPGMPPSAPPVMVPPPPVAPPPVPPSVQLTPPPLSGTSRPSATYNSTYITPRAVYTPKPRKVRKKWRRRGLHS
jgi:hypothetical protein